MPYEREMLIARAAAVSAGETALRYRGNGFAVETKADESPVTEADRACEAQIAGMLERAFPQDGVLGEEGALKQSHSGRRWIIDPIDGTRDFIRGNRLWATLIGLEDHGEVVAGVAHFPALAETYCASLGLGSYRNDSRISASGTSELAQAVFCFNGIQHIIRWPGRDRLLDFCAQCWAIRSMGGAPDAMLVSSGKADCWLEMSAKPWDLAALKIIAEEAGARFFNLDGGSSIQGGNCLICAPGLERAIREALLD